MHKNELAGTNICFALHGYDYGTLSWLEKTVEVFAANNYPLKSVSYGIYTVIQSGLDYGKFQRKSIKAFYDTLRKDAQYPVDRLCSFTVFAGVNQKYPSTWHYRCVFDKPAQMLYISFDSSYGYENLIAFFKEYLSEILNDATAWTGYSYSNVKSDYPFGGSYVGTHNYYREHSHSWSGLPRRDNIANTIQQHKNKYRHIYPLNILNQYHMEERIDGKLIEEWVTENNCGIIEKIGMSNWLWTVPEENLEVVQKCFYDKGLLLGAG